MEVVLLRTLIVGLGRAGLGLHLPLLRRARQAAKAARLFSGAPPVAVDPRGVPTPASGGDLIVAASLARARQMLDPEATVVHVCTPPAVRLEVLQELAELGFRKILVEKPLATDREALADVIALRRAFGLELTVVAHWLDSPLTERIAETIRSGALGGLRELSFVQRKPRYARTLSQRGAHPSVFDVELPHSVGVALRLAGDAEVTGAACTDLEVEGRVIPRMGTARLSLGHRAGAVTEIFSDLTAPVRERSLRVDLDAGRVVGHYPASQDDGYAHLRVAPAGGRETSVAFPDDSLTSFFTRTYGRYRDGGRMDGDFELNVEVVTLLCDAKDLSSPGVARDQGGTCPATA